MSLPFYTRYDLVERSCAWYDYRRMQALSADRDVAARRAAQQEVQVEAEPDMVELMRALMEIPKRDFFASPPVGWIVLLQFVLGGLLGSLQARLRDLRSR